MGRKYNNRRLYRRQEKGSHRPAEQVRAGERLQGCSYEPRSPSHPLRPGPTGSHQTLEEGNVLLQRPGLSKGFTCLFEGEMEHRRRVEQRERATDKQTPC